MLTTVFQSVSRISGNKKGFEINQSQSLKIDANKVIYVHLQQHLIFLHLLEK